MDYLLYVIAEELKGDLPKAIDVIHEVEKNNISEFISIFHHLSLTIKIELFGQKDVVNFIDTHFQDQDIIQLMDFPDAKNNFWPKTSHKLWKRVKNDLPRTIYWEYNANDAKIAVTWERIENMYENPWKEGDMDFLLHLTDMYIPHLSEFSEEIPWKNGDINFVLNLTDEVSQDIDPVTQYQTRFAELMKKATRNRYDQILWSREQKRKFPRNPSMLFNLKKDKLLAEIFFVDPHCMSISMSPEMDGCKSCQITESQWNEFDLNWRCEQMCEMAENEIKTEETDYVYLMKQCPRFCISKENQKCNWHTLYPTESMDYMPFLYAEDLNTFLATKYRITNPFFLMGPGALKLWKAQDSVLPASSLLGSRFTILAEYPPPTTFPITLLYKQKANEEEQLESMSNIKAVFEYTHRDRELGQTYITWVQVTELSDQLDFAFLENSQFSLIEWDQNVFYCSFDKRCYSNAWVIIDEFSWNLTTLEKKEQWFYSLNQISIYLTAFTEEVKRALTTDTFFSFLGNSLLNSFGENPTEILETMIESNIRIRTLHLHPYIPLLLLHTPHSRKLVYNWNEIDIVAQKNSLQLWRSIEEVNIRFDRIEQPTFLRQVNDKFINVFGQRYDINKLLTKEKGTNVPKDRITQLPEHCEDLLLVEDKANIKDFLEEKDESPPIVFLRKYKEKVFAVCMRKSHIRQFLSQEESKYFACIKEGTQYIDPARMYIKLNLFQGVPHFLTLENVLTLLSLEYIYWLEQEDAFLHLPFIGKSTYLTRQGLEMSSLHCQEGTEQTVHLFFPVEINLEPPPPKRRSTRVIMHT